VVAQRGLGEARLDRRAGDADELVVAQTEVLAGDRVFAADAGAEVRRIVGAERERDPGLAQDGNGCSSKLGKTPSTTLLVGQTSSVTWRRASSSHERRDPRSRARRGRSA
jgi:hypothetical protein